MLATGDFHQNDEMLEAFLPLMRGDLFSRNPYGTAQGDGMKMAWWVGAGQDTGPFNIGLCWPHDFTFAENSPSRWGSPPWLRVNIAGERYTNETIGSHEWYSTSPMCFMDVKQPGHTGCQICDSKFGEILEGDKSEIAIFNDCVERGVIYSADTLEELADKVGFTNKDRFLETVQRYNEVCDLGSDVDFGIPASIFPILRSRIRRFIACIVLSTSNGLMGHKRQSLRPDSRRGTRAHRRALRRRKYTFGSRWNPLSVEVVRRQ